MSKVEVGNDVEYRYDAMGRRVFREETQTVIQNDIFEHSSRLNAVIARAVDGSKFDIQWFHKNYLDHVYAVSDDSGDILEHYRYTAFGEVTIFDDSGNIQQTTQIDNDILWNTRRLDEVSGFYLYKYRHYSAELGRWLGRDPIEEDGGVNLYAFVGNDPVSRWDELGLSGLEDFIATVAFYYGSIVDNTGRLTELYVRGRMILLQNSLRNKYNDFCLYLNG